jgi:hypothetical protein
MIFLLYKPIICLGSRSAPVSDACHRFSVALTAQANITAERLNRIYCYQRAILFRSRDPLSIPARLFPLSLPQPASASMRRSAHFMRFTAISMNKTHLLSNAAPDHNSS